MIVTYLYNAYDASAVWYARVTESNDAMTPCDIATTRLPTAGANVGSAYAITAPTKRSASVSARTRST
jgi:hypothetical protein